MNSKNLLYIISTLILVVIPTFTIKVNASPIKDEVIFETNDLKTSENCPKPALSRLVRHQVKTGETLESIASNYNLIPATLMGMNSSIRNQPLVVGSEILIPPYNGIIVEVPAGKTYRDLAKIYKVRPDVLFEINGCQSSPKIVFIPGVNWSPTPVALNSNNDINGYPLPNKTSIILDYGWQLHPLLGKVAFHSGIDLLAPIKTPVLAVGDGVIAFAGKRGNYGNLVVINHQGGKQTRYAHLDSINVNTGQKIKQGEKLGTVGKTGNPDSKETALHFEIRYNSDVGWVAEDPQIYLRAIKISKH